MTDWHQRVKKSYLSEQKIQSHHFCPPQPSPETLPRTCLNSDYHYTSSNVPHTHGPTPTPTDTLIRFVGQSNPRDLYCKNFYVINPITNLHLILKGPKYTIYRLLLSLNVQFIIYLCHSIEIKLSEFMFGSKIWFPKGFSTIIVYTINRVLNFRKSANLTLINTIKVSRHRIGLLPKQRKQSDRSIHIQNLKRNSERHKMYIKSPGEEHIFVIKTKIHSRNMSLNIKH